MTLSLLSNPSKTRFAIKSRAIAALGQIPYEWRKTDDTFTDIATGGGGTKAILNATTAGTYSIGEIIGWITDDGTLKGFGAIDNITGANIRVNQLYRGGIQALAGTIWRPESYTNYVVEVNVATLGGEPINTTPLTFSLNPYGQLFIDLKSILALLALNYRWIEYELEWRERHSTSTPAFTTNENILAVLARRQFLNYAGANLWDVILKQTINTEGIFTTIVNNATKIDIDVGAGDVARYAVGDIIWVRSDDGEYNLRQEVEVVGASTITCTGPYTADAGTGINYVWGGRILSAFATFIPQGFSDIVSPKRWEGWRQTVSVLADQDLDTRETTVIVWYFRPNTVNKAGSGSVQSNSIIQTDIGIQTREIPQPSVIGSDFYVLVYIRSTTGSDNRVERLYFVVGCEPKRPLMVEWVNPLGGFDYWLFSYNQEIGLKANRSVAWETVVDEDYETFEGGDRQVVQDIQETVILMADELTKAQVKALQTINMSQEIYIYLRKDGSKKIRVTVNAGWAIRTDTKAELYQLVFTMIMPKNFQLLEALEYNF